MRSPQRFLCGAATLIELLVVIAVIAVLATVCLVAMRKVRESADTATCAGNLRQIGVGLLSFAQDHNEEFPEAGAVIAKGQISPETQLPGWTEQVEPYMGQGTKVYRCPGSARVIPNNRVYSYFLGTRAVYLETETFGRLNLLRLRAPSRYILAGDIATMVFEKDDADKDDYSNDAAFGIPFEIPQFSARFLNLISFQ